MGFFFVYHRECSLNQKWSSCFLLTSWRSNFIKINNLLLLLFKFLFFGDDHPIEGSCRTFSFLKIVECVTRGVMMFDQEIQSKRERVCLTVILGKSSGIIDPENFRKKSKNDTFFFFYFLIGWGI